VNLSWRRCLMASGIFPRIAYDRDVFALGAQ
jgi:hypothetical protein